MDIKEQITRLPVDWGYVAVDGNKRPYQKDWQKKPLSRAQLFTEIKAGKAKAIGVCCGTPSGGLAFLDHDGSSCDSLLAEWGELPPSWMVTSGRVGRYQIIYRVPKPLWNNLITRKYRTGIEDKDGAIEQIECRWDGCQSVVAGKHPTTDGYRWMEGRSPDDLEIAFAPEWLIQKMTKPEEKAKSVMVEVVNESDYDKALGYLNALAPARADNFDCWLKIGVSLHSVGDDRLFAHWNDWSAQSHKYVPGECEKRWKSFGKRSGITLGTLHHYAEKDGWTGTPRRLPKSLDLPKEEETSIIHKKLEPLSASELVHLLSNLDKEIRFNTFTQTVEMDKIPLQRAELFYIHLAQMGFKVSKELAIDCLLQSAHANEYDPVREYLDNAAKTPPTYIEALATTYFRPNDTPGSIYDSILKTTLIAAVRRCYQPGCKHDSATVLAGPQGCGKSTFWKALFGPFFSDSLGDISDKDSLLQLCRSWGMEWSELDQVTSKKHAGAVKAFLSRSTDMFRVPYGKATEEHPRKGIIVGSTNKSTGLLVDDTGNRRFWIIPVDKTMQSPIDIDSLELERNSIWSAAVAAFKNGEPHFLTKEQENRISVENEDYLVSHPWEPVIRRWLEVPTNRAQILTSDLLLTEAVDKEPKFQTKHDQMIVCEILNKVGYQKKRKSIGGKQMYCWSLPLP